LRSGHIDHVVAVVGGGEGPLLIFDRHKGV
jgi:hypothetical protein